MYRITTMLQALTVNGSTVKNDPKLMSDFHCALNVWFIHDWQNPNWWFNHIDISLQATRLEIENIKGISYRAVGLLAFPFLRMGMGTERQSDSPNRWGPQVPNIFFQAFPK